MRRPARGARTSDPLGLTGWVFADLLLGLAVIFLATQPGAPAPEPTTTTTTTTTTAAPTTTTAPPTTTTTAPPPGVDKLYACFRIQTDPNLLFEPGPARDAHVAALRAALVAELRRLGLDKRRAGVVLSFGAASDPARGREIARAFNELVLTQVPSVFGGAASRPFWDGASAPTGSVAVNLYPLTGKGTKPMPPPPDC